MASFIRHRNGIRYSVGYKNGKRVRKSLQTRDGATAYMLFLALADSENLSKLGYLSDEICQTSAEAIDSMT